MRIWAVLSFFVAASTGFSQGTLHFNNRVSVDGVVIIDAPVSYSGGSPKGPGLIDEAASGYTAMAGLFAGPDGASESQLQLIAPAVNFRGGAAAGYVNVGTAASRTVPGVAPGDYAMAQIRAWDTGVAGSTWEDAYYSPTAYRAVSNLLRVRTGGVGDPPSAAAYLIGLQAFSFAVPEPGAIALGLMAMFAGILPLRSRIRKSRAVCLK